MIKNAIGHLNTINRHKLLVAKYCFKAGLYRQGLLHDLSKYSPAEFITGVRFYQGDKSPNSAERQKYGYSRAWLHHKGRNKHHMEYWTDYSQTGDKCMAGVEMPVEYVVEMFCDRIAACRVYHGDAYTDAYGNVVGVTDRKIAEVRLSVGNSVPVLYYFDAKNETSSTNLQALVKMQDAYIVATITPTSLALIG